MHLWARPHRAPGAIADGPQARVGTAETQREAMLDDPLVSQFSYLDDETWPKVASEHTDLTGKPIIPSPNNIPLSPSN